MKKNNYVFRNELIRKWVANRRGRMTILAGLVGKNRENLYRLIHENRIAPDLLEIIERKQIEIEGLERECIQYFTFFKRFIMKGEGRVARLAEKLKVSSEILRGLARAKGDARYGLLRYGTSQVKAAIRECETERTESSYNREKIDIRAYVTATVKKKHHSLNDVIDLVQVIRENADFGNHDAAVVCRKVSDDRYKVEAIGFDTVFSDMCKSHVCEKDNPHLHAAMFAAINVPRNAKNMIGDLVMMTHTAPCPNCAPRLVNTGINQVYCFYEPELMGGLHILERQGIPVIKINLADRSQRQINSQDQEEQAA